MNGVRHGRASRRWLAVLAAGAALAAGLWAVTSPRPGKAPAATPQQPGSLASGAPSHTVSPVPLPGDLTWSAVAGVNLPHSRSAGPATVRDGRASGFSHDQAGAAFAAMHLVVRCSPRVGPGVFGPTIRDQVYGPDKTALAEQTSADYSEARDRQQVRYGDPLAPSFAVMAGYRVDAYDGTAATVRLLMKMPGEHGDPAYLSSVLQLSFMDGDWRLMAPPRGDWASVRVMVPPSALADYQTVGS